MRTRILALVGLLVTSTLVTSTFWASSPAVAVKAPDTVIKKGPSGRVASTTATFVFKAKPKKGAKLQCRMDSTRWRKCTSPATYTGLAQGDHTFAVRAKSRLTGKKDRSPATRAFTVDTVAPTTVVTGGPASVTGDSTPTFTFAADEPATFACRLGATHSVPCTSPFTPAAPLVDGPHTFEVSATDLAGNIGGAASSAFELLTPVTRDQATMEEAAAFWFPDNLVVDVPAQCGGNVEIDCDGGVAEPPTDQVAVGSTRSTAVNGSDQDLYDHTIDADVTSVPATAVTVTIVLPVPQSPTVTCDVTVDSSAGAADGWSAAVPAEFVDDAGGTRIVPGDLTVSGVEADDISVITPTVECSVSDSLAEAAVAIADSLESELQGRLVPLCAAPGPAYLEPCP